MHARTLVLSAGLTCAGPALAQVVGPGTALDLDAATVAVADDASLDLTDALTIEAWIRADSWATNTWQNVIVGKDGWASGEEGYTLRAGGNGVLSFNIGTGSQWVEVMSAGGMQTGHWHHVAGVYDGATLEVFVDGDSQGYTANQDDIAATDYPLHIGSIPYTAGGFRYFDGRIDEVRLWHAAVSQDVLRAWMCRQLTDAHPDWNDLVGYWTFDEGSGTVAADASGLGNDATIGTATWAPSGAAIGDASAYDYGLDGPLTLEAVTAEVTLGNPDGLQLYRVDGSPGDATASGLEAVEQSHYWGVYVAGGPTAEVQLTVDYGDGGFYDEDTEPRADLAGRSAQDGTWVALGATRDEGGDTLTTDIIGRQELVVGYSADPDTDTDTDTDTDSDSDTDMDTGLVGGCGCAVPAAPSGAWALLGVPWLLRRRYKAGHRIEGQVGVGAVF